MTKKKKVVKNLIKIDEKVAAKVLKIVDKGLINGLGSPFPGAMCVEAAVCYAMNEPHGDKPKCVDPYLRYEKIKLNDWEGWESDADRAQGLRRLAIAQLGSRGNFDKAVFKKLMIKAGVTLLCKHGKSFAQANFKQDLAATKDALAVQKLKAKHHRSSYRAAIKDQRASKKLIKSFKKSLKELSNEKAIYKKLCHLISDFKLENYNKNPVKNGHLGVDIAHRLDMLGMDLLKASKAAAEAMTQVLIKMKIPGTKYLYLTNKKKRKAKK